MGMPQAVPVEPVIEFGLSDGTFELLLKIVGLDDLVMPREDDLILILASL